jgi:hypothetical protein
LTALDRFVLNQIRDAGAKKRAPGSGAHIAGDDWADCLACECPSASQAYDIAWARDVIEQAVTEMREECENSGRRDVWGVFESRLLKPTLEGTEPPGYQQLIEQFGFRTPSEASNVLVTAKRMYVRTLRGVIGQYACDKEEIDAEIAELHTILASSDS